MFRPMRACRYPRLRVRAGLCVGVSDAARDHIAIFSHDFPIPTRTAVWHNPSLRGVFHVILPCLTGGSATGSQPPTPDLGSCR